MDEYGDISQPSSASLLDKTDWRRTIHKCLETCVMCEDTKYYPQTVKSLISAVSANYPGFNAKDIITKEIMEIKEEYKKWTKDYFVKNSDYWHHPYKRKVVFPQILNSYYKDIFEFIKNLLAEKRILLYGIQHLPGGIQLKDEYE
jgi:hypothetical protein